jgi:chemotaxis-related protein WspD
LLLDEIVGLRTIHSLPHRRNPALLGLANVRGELVVCVSIAQLLTGEAATASQGRLIVARHSSGRLAFPVDEVQHTHRYRPDELMPVPATVAKSASAFTKGLLLWQGRTIGCLDERLIFDVLDRGLT